MVHTLGAEYYIFACRDLDTNILVQSAINLSSPVHLVNGIVAGHRYRWAVAAVYIFGVQYWSEFYFYSNNYDRSVVSVPLIQTDSGQNW